MAAPAAIHFTGDPEADAFLGSEPLALLIGFVLDQQVTVQKAFSSPLELSKRLGGTLDAAAIAAMDPGTLEEIFREKPALHRFPANMARRVQEHCSFLASGLARSEGRCRPRAPVARVARNRWDEGADDDWRHREPPRSSAAGVGSLRAHTREPR